MTTRTQLLRSLAPIQSMHHEGSDNSTTTARLRHRRDLDSSSHHLLTTLCTTPCDHCIWPRWQGSCSMDTDISDPDLWCHDHRCNPSSQLEGNVRSAADSRRHRSLSSPTSCMISMDEHTQQYRNLIAVADARQRAMMHIFSVNACTCLLYQWSKIRRLYCSCFRTHWQVGLARNCTSS